MEQNIEKEIPAPQGAAARAEKVLKIEFRQKSYSMVGLTYFLYTKKIQRRKFEKNSCREKCNQILVMLIEQNINKRFKLT